MANPIIRIKVFPYDITLNHSTSVTDDDRRTDRRQSDDNRTISSTVILKYGLLKTSERANSTFSRKNVCRRSSMTFSFGSIMWELVLVRTCLVLTSDFRLHFVLQLLN